MNGLDQGRKEGCSQEEAFNDRINNLGRLTSLIALVGMLAVPIIVILAFNIEVNWFSLLPIAGSLVAIFAPVAVVECISYYAIIGAGGMYLSCITGNVLNMKLPCALSGMKIAGVEPGSKRGDIISILSIGVSSIVTSIILFLGMLAIGEFLAPLLDHPVLQAGFENIMPAMMGAIAVPFIINSPKLAFFPVVISLSLYLSPLGAKLFNPFNQSYTLLGIMIASGIVAYRLHKKGLPDRKN